MLVSISKKFIFVEVPKTGSSSLTSALRGSVFTYGMRHVSAKKIRSLIGKDWKEYETWAVVRQPVDWLQSWYSFLKKSELNGLDRGVSIENQSFNEFIKNYILSLSSENTGERSIDDSGRKSILMNSKLRPQRTYLSDPDTGRLLVKNIIPFDYLDIGLAIFAQQHSIKKFELPNLNSSGRTKGGSDIDDETRKLIEHYWRDDYNVYNNTIRNPIYRNFHRESKNQND